MPSMNVAPQPRWIPERPEIKKVGDSEAPSGAGLIGAATGDVALMLAPRVGSMLEHASASVRGFFEDPLNPGEARDQLLADSMPGFDVAFEGGSLRALHAMSDELVIHLTPDSFDPKFSGVHIHWPIGGKPEDVSVRAHPHAPDAPAGLYNAAAAGQALDDALHVLDAAIAAPSSRVNEIRAQDLRDRVGTARAWVGELEQAASDHPELASLISEASVHAYKVRKPNDEHDVGFTTGLSKLRDALNAAKDELPADVYARAEQDVGVLQADHGKWLSYHSNNVASYYLSRGE